MMALTLSVPATFQAAYPFAFGEPVWRKLLYRACISLVSADCADVGLGTVPNWPRVSQHRRNLH